jgi:hypothetical protein
MKRGELSSANRQSPNSKARKHALRSASPVEGRRLNVFRFIHRGLPL